MSIVSVNGLFFLLFWMCVLAIMHSYLFYPMILKQLSKTRTIDNLKYRKNDDLPIVSVIMSVFNEAVVIEEKMKSLINTNYPLDKIQFFVGSDASTDKTNDILEQQTRENPTIRFFPFTTRRGKPEVVNELVETAIRERGKLNDHILLLTDASVMLKPQTIFHLVKHFKDERVGLVDTNMQHTGMQKEGISQAEYQYISREVTIKHLESIVWKTMIGPFGGCYAIRSTAFAKIPANFLVDDFFVTMKILEKGLWAMNDLDAVCYEPVSHELSEEFRRKKRISAGNFQNMLFFRHLWWPPTLPLNFAFFSHKIIRWLGPFLIIVLILCALYLAYQGFSFFIVTFLLISFLLFFLPILDYFLTLIGINVLPLRNVRYFILMNAALLFGFFKFLKGIKSNVWQPTKRHTGI